VKKGKIKIAGHDRKNSGVWGGGQQILGAVKKPDMNVLLSSVIWWEVQLSYSEYKIPRAKKGSWRIIYQRPIGPYYRGGDCGAKCPEGEVTG